MAHRRAKAGGDAKALRAGPCRTVIDHVDQFDHFHHIDPVVGTTLPPSIDPEGMGMTSPGQQLPATGASPSPWLWVGVALLAVGTAAVMLARKKGV